MTAMTFVPAATGGWIAVASGSELVLLEPTAAGRVDRMWETLASAGAFERIIRLVAEDGFCALPQFALVEWVGDHLRAVVRGGVTLEVEDADGSHRQDGRGVSTWTERGFDGVTAVRVIVAGASPLDGFPPLPLRAGAAVVASCSLVADAELDDRTVVVERPGPQPTPVPETGPTPPRGPERREARWGEAVGSEGPSPLASDATVSGATLSHPIPSAAASAAAPASGDDALSNDTVLVPRRGSESPTTPVQAEAPPESALVGDHDGLTVVSSAIPKGRQPRPARQSERQAAPEPIVIVLPDGRRERLDQPILVGRSPSAMKVSGDKLPRLVTVGGSDQDISRTHVRFALEGDSVVVTDLHSRNGTLVVLPGKTPQKLRAGEPTTVVLDTVIDLGGNITLTVTTLAVTGG